MTEAYPASETSFNLNLSKEIEHFQHDCIGGEFTLPYLRPLFPSELREESGLKVFEDRLLRGKFAPNSGKLEKVT
jgi:hypothetical protein